MASFPELENTPIIIGESDPEGCAACPVRTNPSNAYRNGTMYSSYTAEQIARTYELADPHSVNLLGSVTWAFEFEDQPYFDGFRDLATNGIDKPVLNVFRMLGQMTGDRVDGRELRRAAARGRPRSRACATGPTSRRSRPASARSVAVLVWNYHDDDLPAPAADVELTIDGLPQRGRRDALSRRRRAQQRLHALEDDGLAAAADGRAVSRARTGRPAAAARTATARHVSRTAAWSCRSRLPRQGVSLVKLVW